MTTPSSTAAASLSPAHRRVVLLTLCLAAFTINLDTTIVNVTLPTLVRDLNASTRQLQGIVDSYNLVFAALVLAAGSISDAAVEQVVHRLAPRRCVACARRRSDRRRQLHQRTAGEHR